MSERETLPGHESEPLVPNNEEVPSASPERREGTEKERGALSADVESTRADRLKVEVEDKPEKPAEKERALKEKKEPKGFFEKVKKNLGQMWSRVKDFFGRWFGHKKTEKAMPSERNEEDFLREILAERPQYRKWMQEAGHGKEGELEIPEEIFLATAKIESRFREDVRNQKSSATGLFQFIDKTWKGTPYGHLDRKDPETSIKAVAWFIRDNVKKAKLDPESPEFAKNIYLVHHEGVEGFQLMDAYKHGDHSKTKTVPESYMGKEVMDVMITDYPSYVEAMDRLAERFALLVKRYRVVLNDLDKPKIT